MANDIEIARLTATDATSPAFNSVKRSMESLGVSANTVRNALGAIGIGLSFAGVVQTIGAAVRAFTEAERSVRLLEATLKSTGYSAGLTGKEIEAMVQSLTGTTLFDDESLREAAVALLRFRSIAKESFGDALIAATNFATATGGDVKTAAVAIGRAMQDPVGGMRNLREVGIKLSESQVELAKTMREAGDTAGANRIILEELDRTVGGGGGSLTGGLIGSSRTLGKSWNELMEALGRQVDTQGVIGPLDSAAGAVNRLTAALNSSEVGRALGRMGALMGAPGGALVGVGTQLAMPKAGGGGGTAKVSQDEWRAAMGKLNEEAAVAEEALLAKMKKTDEEWVKGAAKRLADRIAAVKEETRMMMEGYKDRTDVLGAEWSVEKDAQDKRDELQLEAARKLKGDMDALWAQTKTAQLADIERRWAALNDKLIATTIDQKQYTEMAAILEAETNKVLGRDPFADFAEKGKDSMRELIDAIEGWGRRSADVFADFAMGGKASFSDLINSMIRDLIALAAYKAVFGPLFAAVGAMIGGPGGAVAAGSLQAIGPIGAAAGGGPVSGGSSYLVGEKGMEIFTPNTSGVITPNNAIGGGVVINQTNHFNSGADPATMSAWASAVKNDTLATLAQQRRRGQ